MTLLLDTLRIVEGYSTGDWREYFLEGMDSEQSRVVVATKSAYIGNDEHKRNLFKHATVETSLNNLNNLKQYLQCNNIDTLFKWINQASNKARVNYIYCFKSENPYFSREQKIY